MNITWSDIKAKAAEVDRTAGVGDNVVYIDNGLTKIYRGLDGTASILNGGEYALYDGRMQWPLDAVYSWLDD